MSEQLTDAERECLRGMIRPTSWDDVSIAEDVALAKLLRIEAEQRERIAELEEIRDEITEHLRSGSDVMRQSAIRIAELEATIERVETLIDNTIGPVDNGALTRALGWGSDGRHPGSNPATPLALRIEELETENTSLRDMLRAALEQPALESGNRRAELETEFGRILDYECGVCGRVYRGHEREPCCSRCGSHSKQAEVKLPQG